MISKAELIAYFVSTNSKAIRVAFQHEFNETTYFKPTFCAHCAGLVSQFQDIFVENVIYSDKENTLKLINCLLSLALSFNICAFL